MSQKQDKISYEILNNDNEIYIDAVCGAGKTEIVFKSIEKSLFLGERVGFICPRREVVIEIYKRLKDVFPSTNIISVYGGHTEFLNGDIICLTCHQAYRYKQKFGLVILDEYDAFPLSGNKTLLEIVKETSYKKIIYLSATFSKDFLKDKESKNLNRRYHGYDIPVPNIFIGSFLKQILYILKFCRHNQSSIFIFVPTISVANKLFNFLRLFFRKIVLFTSKPTNKTIITNKIKSKEVKIVVCTTILERGITISDLDVLVFESDHKIFDTSTLIQIVGRVGRKTLYPHGRVVFMAKTATFHMKKCIATINEKNSGFEL